MSVAWPDSIDSDLRSRLEDAFAEIFDATVPDPHERGDQTIAETATVEGPDDAGRYVVTVHVSMPFQKYLDATQAGDNYEDVDDHADNPGMVVYHALEEYGIPRPVDDPKHGVRIDRANEEVDIQAVVHPSDVTGGGD